MPIAGRKPLTETDTNIHTPTIEPAGYEGSIVDDLSTPILSLIAYVEGAPWSVDYYSQMVGEHNDLREIDPNQPLIYQSYQKINGLELRVQSPLSTSYNSETGITSSNGTALIYPFLAPNVNDYFITDAGDNKIGLFRIISVERKTFNRDSVFSVDYTLDGYIDQKQDVIAALKEKTLREYFFDKERLVEGLQPLLRSEEYTQLRNLKSIFRGMIDHYFTSFFNPRYSTLVIPGQDIAIYDARLVGYLLRIVEVTDHPLIQRIRQIPTDNDPYLKQDTIWDIMVRRDYEGLKFCNKKMMIVSKSVFLKNPALHGIVYSNIEYLIYPETPDTTAMVRDLPFPKLSSNKVVFEVEGSLGTPAALITENYASEGRNYLSAPTVLQDDFYIFTQSFYDGAPTQTLIEILTKDYLNRKTLDLEKLSFLCSRYRYWGRLEQFYYGPILMTLIREADRRTYS